MQGLNTRFLIQLALALLTDLKWMCRHMEPSIMVIFGVACFVYIVAFALLC